MIKVNNNQYLNYKNNVYWSNFKVYSNDNVRIGCAPFITFNIEDKMFIGLELLYSKEMFINIELNKKTNICKYISDITYKDEKGWISIINGNYNCSITKMGSNDFRIEFNVISDDIDAIDIYIDTNIELL